MKRFISGQTQAYRFSVVLLSVWQLSTVAFALDQSTGPQGSNVQAVWTAGTGYTGQGVAVGLISQDHVRTTHEAFDGHAHWYDATGQNTYLPSNHDTSVGGIICSRGGVEYPNHKGTAPDAELFSVKVTDSDSVNTHWLEDALDYLVSQNCRVVVTGIQFPDSSVTPDGNSIWSLIYDYYAYRYNLVFATAAGNYESAVTVFGDTYNSITTGGLIGTSAGLYDKVGTGSNPGPTDDNRQKPEIAAPSQSQWVPVNGDAAWANVGSTAGQTSWAVPHTGGVAAVLLDYADTTMDTNDNRSEVIKAVIVNSTFPNIVSKSGTATTGLTWQADRGYGRIDALRAYEILSESPLSPGTNSAGQKGWTYQVIAKRNEVNTFRIYGLKNERFVLTITWNREITKNITGNYVEESSPKFNIDLSIRSPQGAVLFSETDTLNNLQKADILLPEDGFYEVVLTNTTSKRNRGYGLAFELLPPLEADFNIDYVVNDQDLADFAFFWTDTGCLDSTQACFDYNLMLDDSINLADFSVFANQWLSYDPRYYSP